MGLPLSVFDDSGSHSGDGTLFDTIASALETTGYIVLPAVFDPAALDSLFLCLKSLDESCFSAAGIGRDDEHQLNRFVRTDRIHWLEHDTPETAFYMNWCEQLRQGLNRRLFLGLFDYECHFAWYRPGSFYKRHLDAFRNNNSRVISTILYLNPAWQPGDGGELVIHDPDADRILEQVEPRFGSLVIFLSDIFPHEVLTARRSRYSLTGWYRINNTDSQNLDPTR